MNYRLRGFLRGLRRLILVVLCVGLLFAGWRAFLRFGPRWMGGGQSAMLPFHAKLLVTQRLGLPHSAAEVVIPAPQSMSSADVQLRLMKWWDGKNWLPEALARGGAGKGGLHLRAGELTLVDITRVGTAEIQKDQVVCQVRFKVRWDFPKDLQEMLRVKDIVNLRMPKGPAPGQGTEVTCTFIEHGWQWIPAPVESPWGGKWERKVDKPWMEWIF